MTVYLHVPPTVALARAYTRDLELFGTREAIDERYRRRYVPAHELYRSLARPAERADIVVDMSEPGRPVLLRTR